MKVRRRTGSGFSWAKLISALNPRGWFRGSRSTGRNGGSAATSESLAEQPGTGHHPPTQDHTGAGGSETLANTGSGATRISRTMSGRGRPRAAGMKSGWLFGGTFVGSLLTGYLIAAVFFFPAPFFSSQETVPRVIDLPLEDAQAAIEAANLTAGEPRRESHPSYASGHVAWQDPPEGVRVPAGTIVRLATSRGPQQIPVPDVSRYDSDLATTLITRSGLTVQRRDSIQTALPRGVAVGSRPAAGTTLAPGSGVILIVSRGAPTISVPDLAGLTLEEAQEELGLLGLTMGRSWQEFSNAQAEGLIFRQEPPAGTLIASGTPINVVIARTP